MGPPASPQFAKQTATPQQPLLREPRTGEYPSPKGLTPPQTGHRNKGKRPFSKNGETFPAPLTIFFVCGPQVFFNSPKAIRPQNLPQGKLPKSIPTFLINAPAGACPPPSPPPLWPEMTCPSKTKPFFLTKVSFFGEETRQNAPKARDPPRPPPAPIPQDPPKSPPPGKKMSPPPLCLVSDEKWSRVPQIRQPGPPPVTPPNPPGGGLPAVFFTLRQPVSPPPKQTCGLLGI